jgi:hypothetical protein
MATGRIRRKAIAAAWEEAAVAVDAPPAPCGLCGRPLGRKVEWHHPVPKSRGGRETVAIHPICHRTIHATLTNAELERIGGDMATLAAVPAIARFIAWVADKDPDFSAPTRRSADKPAPAKDRFKTRR